MYADTITRSMREAIDETSRRRERQIAYNTERGIDPQPLRKKIADITELLTREAADSEEMLSERTSRHAQKSAAPRGTGKSASRAAAIGAEGAGKLEELIADLTEQMLAAAAELKFELAARLRDEVSELKRELRSFDAAGHR